MKYSYWAARPKPAHFLELSDDTLNQHPLYVASDRRASFGRKETRPRATPRPLDDGWREWMAACAILGIDDDHIRLRSHESGRSPQ